MAFKVHPLPPIEVLRKHFRVDEHSRLERKTATNGWQRCSKKYGGSDYFTMGFQGRRYLAHRVIWALHYGSEPTGIIDHINGKPWDNRIENLRDVDHSRNRMNTPNTRVNKSGYPNVSKNHCKFTAKVVAGGVMRWSPPFDDAELAGLAAQEMVRRYHGEYAPQQEKAA